MRSFVQGGEELLEGIHISISALLRGSKGIFMVVPECIATCVVFDSQIWGPDNLRDIEWFWTCLDVPPKLMDLFVKVNPQWDGTSLHCSASLAGDADRVSAVTTVIHLCLHWCDSVRPVGPRWACVADIS